MNAIVIGAGGHAKVVISTLRAAGWQVVAAFDDDSRKRGGSLLGVPVAGCVVDASAFGIRQAVIAIGDNAARQKVAQMLDLDWISVVHPAAWADPSVRLGPGTVVFAGAVLQPDSSLGAHVIVNTGATVDHDCQLGHFVHLAPGVHLAGNVRVGDGALLGIGCAAIPGRSIGAWSTVGAGALVLGDIRERVVAVGIPAIERPGGK